MVDQQTPKMFLRGKELEKIQTGDLLLEIGSEIEQVLNRGAEALEDSIYSKLPDDLLPHHAALKLLEIIKSYGFNSEVNLLVAKRAFIKLISILNPSQLILVSKALTDVYFVYGDPYLEYIEIVNEKLSHYRAFKEG